jgi:hypothetical protein
MCMRSETDSDYIAQAMHIKNGKNIRDGKSHFPVSFSYNSLQCYSKSV